MRLFWIMSVDSKYHHKVGMMVYHHGIPCLYKKEAKREIRHTQKRKASEDGDRGWNDVASSP